MTKTKNTHGMKVYYRISEYDENNKLISKGKRKKSKSFVIGFTQLLYVMFSNVTTPIRDITNTLRNIPTAAHNMTCAAPAGDISRGIVVGTGTTAVATSNFRLEAMIPHGSAANQLFYETSHVNPVTITATNTFFTIDRTIRNLTPAAITITEVGVIQLGTIPAVIHSSILAIRDIVTPRAILPGRSLLFEYEFVLPL